MKFFIVVVFTLFALVCAQFGDFGFASGYGGIMGQLISQRDPRANTGPVLFPPVPQASGETSGVVPGVSGFGFVPPNNPRSRYHYFF